MNIYKFDITNIGMGMVQGPGDLIYGMEEKYTRMLA